MYSTHRERENYFANIFKGYSLFLTPYVGIAEDAWYIIIIKQVPIATTFSDCASPVAHSSLT